MFAMLALAAALSAAPIDAAAGNPATPSPDAAAQPAVPAPRTRGPLPTGSTLPPATANARPSIGFISASSLAERCESSAATLVSYCFAYITGVHDTVRAYETWLRVREFCPPFTSAQGDMRRAFLTYLKANPGAGSGEAASVIVLAFKDQFSCDAPTVKSEVKTTAPATRPAGK